MINKKEENLWLGNDKNFLIQAKVRTLETK